MITNLAQPYTYKATLEAAHKVTWRIEDIIGDDKRLDFSKPFLPESLVDVEPITCLNPAEKIILNQIRGNSYLYLFGVVEEFIVPLVLQHIQQIGTEDIVATQAYLCFAEEEGKHIHLFRRFGEAFKAGFSSPCGVIGPARMIANTVLRHHPLGIALATLMIEWMTQRHYLDSVQDNQSLDPQFCSLLKHHWMEEAQHAKLDTLMVEAMVQNLNNAEIQKGADDFFAIGEFLNGGLIMQTQLDIESLEAATGRKFTEAEKQEIQTIQEQSYRWTMLGSGMTHPHFLKTLSQLSESAAAQCSMMIKR
jgi:hypothetical protein